MIDNYVEIKRLNLVSLSAKGSAFVANCKRFDECTGEETVEEVAVDKDVLIKEKDFLLKKVADIDAMVKDILQLSKEE